MEKNHKLYNKVLAVIKLFKDRPNHFADFIIQNNMLSNKFITVLEHMQDIDIEKVNSDIFFASINEMKEYYTKLLSLNVSDDMELLNELQHNLSVAVSNEDFELACQLRDMIRKMKKINKND